MTTDTVVTDERLREMVGMNVPCVPANPGEVAAIVQELIALRSRPTVSPPPPQERDLVLEEAAKVAETITQDGDYDLEPEATVAASVAGKQIATAIRALRASPPASPTEAGEAGK